MIQANASALLSSETYLEAEKSSAIKHEYINGQVYAMAGASDAHVTICANLTALLRPHLRGQPCRLYPSDMKVRISERDCYYYPDLFVTCDERDQNSTYFKEHPRLIIEVLSDSTEAFDRGDKFDDYSAIATLQEYVLVNQKQRRIDCFRRNKQGVWFLVRYRSGDQLVLESINFRCAVAEVYEDVSFPMQVVDPPS
ncbi:MAG: Uma2 family endonuclease [Spirulina sp. SIO3F2]|nr:Uma2 family endonuclease [Spirulina sp. SIO3F2]